MIAGHGIGLLYVIGKLFAKTIQKMRVVGLGSEGPESKSHLAVELIPGVVDSACHPSEVSKMSASMLVSCVGVVTCPGMCPIAKETASAAPTLCTEYGPDGPNGFSMCACSFWPILINYIHTLSQVLDLSPFTLQFVLHSQVMSLSLF